MDQKLCYMLRNSNICHCNQTIKIVDRLCYSVYLSPYHNSSPACAFWSGGRGYISSRLGRAVWALGPGSRVLGSGPWMCLAHCPAWQHCSSPQMWMYLQVALTVPCSAVQYPLWSHRLLLVLMCVFACSFYHSAFVIVIVSAWTTGTHYYSIIVHTYWQIPVECMLQNPFNPYKYRTASQVKCCINVIVQLWTWLQITLLNGSQFFRSVYKRQVLNLT